MPALQELTSRQADDSLRSAMERQVPITITVRAGETWVNLRSRLLALTDSRLLIEYPIAEDDAAPLEFAPADKLGVSFKLKHHKHVFNGVVAGVEQYSLGNGMTMPVLALVPPAKMQRVQRRSFIRADVPPNRIVRASFWLGGREAEPAGATPDRPVWSGCVINLSAGGFQLRARREAAQYVEVGDTVGVRIVFGAGQEAVFADAQYRHLETKEDEALMGFQFVGLLQTPEGQDALRVISRKVNEYQHAAELAEARQRGD